MAKTTRAVARGLRQRLALSGFALVAVALVSGCGAEADQGVKSVPVEQATKVPVAGMSKEDYAKEMQQKAAQMGGGGMGAPGGMPPGGMPGGAPGGMPPGGAPPGAPPGPPH